jgi:hypothetical protein
MFLVLHPRSENTLVRRLFTLSGESQEGVHERIDNAMARRVHTDAFVSDHYVWGSEFLQGCILITLVPTL